MHPLKLPEFRDPPSVSHLSNDPTVGAAKLTSNRQLVHLLGRTINHLMSNPARDIDRKPVTVGRVIPKHVLVRVFPQKLMTHPKLMGVGVHDSIER